MKRRISLFFVAIIGMAEAKVSVYAHYFGQPEFIKYQYLFFNKNLLDEYEFVIFEDARDSDTSAQICMECEKYGITYVHIPSSVFEYPTLPVTDSYVSLGAPSFQCSVATQYIYDHYVLPSKNVCVIVDNDIFLIAPMSIEKFLGDYSFCYVHQERRGAGELVCYMLPNFIIFNPLLMPEKEKVNFNMGTILGSRTDSGGYTYFYLKDYSSFGKRTLPYYLWNTSSPLKDHFSEQCPLLFNSAEWGSHYFLEKETFLHIRMGSNWSRHPKYGQMQQEIVYLFEALLK